MKARMLVLALLAASALDAAAGGIFRCSTGGGIAYQELPCEPGSEAGRLELPSAFPEVDVAARERLLQREAALDRRLEAQRERVSREEMTRIAARAQVAAAQAAAAPVSEPVYVVAWPVAPARWHGAARRGHGRGAYQSIAR